MKGEVYPPAATPEATRGWGEGEKNGISSIYIPLPVIPSRQGRGNLTFYGFITFEILNFGHAQRRRLRRVLGFTLRLGSGW